MRRRHVCMPPPAHAVYREPGGVPTPPNLRPVTPRRDRGRAPRVCPQAASIRERPCGRGFGVAGSGRVSQVGTRDDAGPWSRGTLLEHRGTVRRPAGLARRAPPPGVQYHVPGAARRAGPAWSDAVPSTYILPDLPWAVLLAPIVRDARPGDVVVVYTDAMRKHVEQVVRAAGRDDLMSARSARRPGYARSLRPGCPPPNGPPRDGCKSPVGHAATGAGSVAASPGCAQ